MIIPVATAYVITNLLYPLIVGTIACSIASALGGYLFAHSADVSIAGSIAMVAGIQFMVAFIYAVWLKQKISFF
jgi:manganese/zinc/iron transport system permease protein